MRINQIETFVQKNPVAPFLVAVHTDDGRVAHGLVSMPLEATDAGGGLVHHLFAPALVGHDARFVEPALEIARRAAVSIGFRGLAARCYAAIDLALWDLKAKAADAPVWQLLGGARTEVSAFRALEVGERFEPSRPLRVRGSTAPMAGVLVNAGGPDPEADVHYLQELQGNHGDSLWIAVSARGRYDLDAALGVGHFLEEDLGADWFEDPLPAHDRAGYARLADRLDVPLAVGSTFDDPTDFRDWIVGGQVRVIRPDLARLGGLTATLPVIRSAELHGVGVVPVGPAEVCLHLACGLSPVRMVQADGATDFRLAAPTSAGWGFTSSSDKSP